MNRPPSIVDDVPYVKIMRSLGLEPDRWQVEVLESKQPRVLLNCSRQAGKSTVVAVLGLISAMFQPMSNIVLVSRSHRQSRELLRLMRFFYRLLGDQDSAVHCAIPADVAIEDYADDSMNAELPTVGDGR